MWRNISASLNQKFVASRLIWFRSKFVKNLSDAELCRSRRTWPVEQPPHPHISVDCFLKNGCRKKTGRNETELYTWDIQIIFITDIVIFFFLREFPSRSNSIVLYYLSYYISTYICLWNNILTFSQSISVVTRRYREARTVSLFYGIKPAQLQLLWQQFKTLSKYFRCTNSFRPVYLDSLRSLSRC